MVAHEVVFSFHEDGERGTHATDNNKKNPTGYPVLALESIDRFSVGKKTAQHLGKIPERKLRR